MPTHAPQPLVTRPGSVPTLLSYYAHGSPMDVALSWVVSIPESPRGGVGTSRVRLPPTGTKTMALEPPFSYCSEIPGPEASSWCCPLHSLSYPLISGGDTVNALTWRRLILATPPPGDASSWRRLNLATTHPGDALSGQPVDLPPCSPWMGPTICLTSALTLTLVNALGRDGTEAPRS